MMNKELEKITKKLESDFDVKISNELDQVSILIDSEKALEVATALKTEHSFEMLASLTAVDYFGQAGPRYHVVYQFNSYSRKIRIEVRATLFGDDPIMESLTSIYPNANWLEREIYDMFGIEFSNHPDMRRILMPDDWEGHPLRKDYPLGYEEVQFSFNHEEIQKRKPHPKS
jgi:NADH-quinone oxidoreductase subunit C